MFLRIFLITAHLRVVLIQKNFLIIAHLRVTFQCLIVHFSYKFCNELSANLVSYNSKCIRSPTVPTKNIRDE